MVAEQLYLRKILCGCFHFIWLWLLISIMKKYAERCALQLYQTLDSLSMEEETVPNDASKHPASFNFIP